MVKRIGLFYGIQTGNPETVAVAIRAQLFFLELDSMDFTGKKVAYLGYGNPIA